MSKKVKLRIRKDANEKSVNFGDTLIDGEFFGEKEQECIDFARELESIRKAVEDHERRKLFGRG